MSTRHLTIDNLSPEEVTAAELIPTGALVWWSTGMVGIYKARVTGYYRDRIFGLRAEITITERQNYRTYQGGQSYSCPIGELLRRDRYRLATRDYRMTLIRKA